MGRRLHSAPARLVAVNRGKMTDNRDSNTQARRHTSGVWDLILLLAKDFSLMKEKRATNWL